MPNTEIEKDEELQFELHKNSQYFPFVIDYNNRIIRVIPGVERATATRKFLKLRPEFLLSGVLECDTTVVSVAGTAGETTLNSYTVPLNTISRNMANTAATSGRDFKKTGNAFRIRASGPYTTDDALALITLNLKVGSTTHLTVSNTQATVTNAQWCIDWLLIIATIGSSGTSESAVTAFVNNIAKSTSTTATVAIDTTAAQIISLTATWSGGSAGDTISIRQFLVELIN